MYPYPHLHTPINTYIYTHIHIYIPELSAPESRNTLKAGSISSILIVAFEYTLL